MNKKISILDIFDESWEQYKHYFKEIFILSLILYIPLHLFLFFYNLEEKMMASESLTTFFLVILLALSLLLLNTICIMLILKDDQEGKKIRLKKILIKGFQKWLPVAITLILLFFFLTLSLLLIIPAIIFSIYWMFSLHAMVFYNKVGKSALDYSKAIVKGRWWRVFIYSLIVFLVVGVFALKSYDLRMLLPESRAIDIIEDMINNIIFVYPVIFFIVFFQKLDETKIALIKNNKS